MAAWRESWWGATRAAGKVSKLAVGWGRSSAHSAAARTEPRQAADWVEKWERTAAACWESLSAGRKVPLRASPLAAKTAAMSAELSVERRGR